MEKQLEYLKSFFEHLGVKDATQVATAFLTPADGSEPSFDLDAMLGQVKSYADKNLQPNYRREHLKEFKGQYSKEQIRKIVAASDGKLTEADFERTDDSDDNVGRAIAALKDLSKGSNKPDETTEKYNKLLQDFEAIKKEREESEQAIHSQYAEKENGRLVYDTGFAKLNQYLSATDKSPAKKLSVDQQHAVKTILRDLGDEYALRYDEEAKDIAVYNKSNPQERAQNGNVPIKFNELMEQALTKNAWIAQSNGSTRVGQQQSQRQVPPKNNGYQPEIVRTGLRGVVEAQQ